MKYILQVVNTKKYISCLPTKHSEMSYLTFTDKITEAEQFFIEELNDISEWLDKDYEAHDNEFKSIDSPVIAIPIMHKTF